MSGTGLGNSVIRLAARCPELSRRVLAAYLRSGLPVLGRHEWLVLGLRRALVPSGSLERIVRIGRGLRVEVSLGTSIGQEIYYRGSGERNMARFIERVLKPGGVVLDCGANVGEMSLRASRAVGATGRVYSLEPSPGTAAMLRKNLALNRAQNVEVLEFALSDRDGSCRFFLGSGLHSQSSSLWQPRDYSGQLVEVRSVTLATLLAERGIGRLDLIKLDIEGAELSALKGAGPGLARLAQRPLIVFEYNKRVASGAGWTLDDAASVLGGLGYEMTYLDGLRAGCVYSSADASGFDEQTNIDLVCRPRAG